MKQTFYLLLLVLFSCESSAPDVATQEDQIIPKDSLPAESMKKTTPPEIGDSLPKIYSNKRFRKVTVEKTGEDTFRIRGEGQIFEASFSWVVEDGHEQLKKGFEMTGAGAPEWGKFDFKITVRKKRENSTLTLILFEASAMDGSPQHELPVLLE